ncbi:MAG: cyclic pyranopterin monophosphate synthase MoaC [Armatimonadota bacterium]|nr:MAG: cyclic pyranopterin monophosphate synthase MoaC [Armatimonadota bacterium]
MAERADERMPVRMVDVGSKPTTQREATARVELRMRPDTLVAIDRSDMPKGDVIAAANIAGVTAAKRTWDLIPLCHQIPLSSVDLRFETRGRLGRMIITATARTNAPTGAEMEAMVAAAMAALTVYDMCKGSDPGIQITNLTLVQKTGGKSGSWVRPEE